MIERVIEGSVRNRFVVLIVAAALAVFGVYAMLDTPVDAVPDLGENQVIVFTDWAGRSPREIEDQVSYPLSRRLQGLAGVKTVRSSSEFGFSMITIIFEDRTDLYFARQRVSERLAEAGTFLPKSVTPYLGPDATALGQIFWYTLEPSKDHPIDPVAAVGAQQVLRRAATQRRGRGRGGRPGRRHAGRVPGGRAARRPAGLWRHGGRTVRRGESLEPAGGRRRDPKEQRRVHRPRRRLDQGQGGHREHGGQGGGRRPGVRQDGGDGATRPRLPAWRVREGRQRGGGRGSC